MSWPLVAASIYAVVSVVLAAYWWHSFRRASDEFRSELLVYRWPVIFGWPLLLTLGPLASWWLRRHRGRP